MFGVDWSNAETLWLNLTNLGLGLVVLGCLGVVAHGVLGDLREKGKFSVRVRSVDREMKDLLGGALQPHVINSPELGLLMADGGEPIKDPKARTEKATPKNTKGTSR